jgi:hypothetical protein
MSHADAAANKMAAVPVGFIIVFSLKLRYSLQQHFSQA